MLTKKDLKLIRKSVEPYKGDLALYREILEGKRDKIQFGNGIQIGDIMLDPALLFDEFMGSHKIVGGLETGKYGERIVGGFFNERKIWENSGRYVLEKGTMSKGHLYLLHKVGDKSSYEEATPGIENIIMMNRL